MQILNQHLCGNERIETQEDCVRRHQVAYDQNPTSARLLRSLKREQRKLKTLEKGRVILRKYPGLSGMALSAAFAFESIPEGHVKDRLAVSLTYSQRSDMWMGRPLPMGRVTIEMVQAERARIMMGQDRPELPLQSVTERLEHMEAVRYPNTHKKPGITPRKRARR